MDILRLLEDLKKLIEEPRSWGPVTWGLDKDEISMQIAKIRASLPQELKAAVSTVRESERIIDTAREDASMTLETARKEAERIVTDAKADADRILEQARLQQERMVADSEILKLSKAQSEEIRSAADRDSVQMRRGAEKYAYDVLSQLEGVVGKVMTTIERGKSEMGRTEGNANNTPERIAREKSRV
jgi:cell division septum initiation protein DivIVA